MLDDTICMLKWMRSIFVNVGGVKRRQDGSSGEEDISNNIRIERQVNNVVDHDYKLSMTTPKKSRRVEKYHFTHEIEVFFLFYIKILNITLL